MRRFKIRFNDTFFEANEDALVEIINLSSKTKDEFYVINEWINPDAVFDTFTEWKFEDTQPLAVVVDGKIELKSQGDKMQEHMWDSIIGESIEKYQDFISKDWSINEAIEERKKLVARMISSYKIEKR